MRLCDLTFAYTPSSGGIRTYLEQKRRYLTVHTDDLHALIVPGETDAVEQDGRLTVYRIASPLLPGCEPYRVFCRPGAILQALREFAPDVVELGSFFLEPWVALRYREQIARERRCLVSGYFHTDLAHAYVGTPVRQALTAPASGWSETLAEWGGKLGDVFEAGATGYFGSLFRRCDLMLAATPAQQRRLADYGCTEAELIPLGVDLACFHPAKRAAAVRERFGAGPETTVLIYAGRLDGEKQVRVLVEAFARLRETAADVRLVLVGEGPLRAELETRAGELAGLHVLPYEAEPERLAALLASADIYVTAGPHETFGLSVIEAQAAGLPVVGVDAGALRERVTPEIGRLGPVGDAAAMAENLAALRPQARALGAAARRHVERNGFAWENSFRRLRDLYHERLTRVESGPGSGPLPEEGAEEMAADDGR